MTSQDDSVGIAVLGAGPAGLTAAYVLGLRGVRGTVYEADGVVGGIAKTVEYDGYRFDLGGHRFFTKLSEIERLWQSMLGDDFLVRPRLSRIYYQGKYYAYPLQTRDVIARLGLLESVLCSLSYFRSQLNRNWKRMDSFEDWVTANFGRRLYDAFFRSYTEKVWGIPGSEIHAEWAVQRIKDFSFRSALLSALHLTRSTPTTLIEEFQYPRLGPGQMWEAFRARAEERGVEVQLNHRVSAIQHEHEVVHSLTIEIDGRSRDVGVDGVLSSIPLSDLVLSLEPAVPAEIRRGRRDPSLPRDVSRRARHRRRQAVPGQLDLPARSGNPSRAGPELRGLEPRHREAREDVPRRRVLLLRGRRDLGRCRTRTRSASRRTSSRASAS